MGSVWSCKKHSACDKAIPLYEKRVGMIAPDNFGAEKFICLNPKVSERIADLRKAGTTGILLADKAEAIISKIKSGEAWQADRKVAPRTAHGEKRIRKCVKYDLGWGHRLVTLLRGDILFICCLGTHDECDRWLEKNSRTKKFEMPNARVCCVAPTELEIQSSPDKEAPEVSDDLEQRLMSLSDRQIRNIFCGLVESRQRNRPQANQVRR